MVEHNRGRAQALRSSPAVEGRCCPDRRGRPLSVAHVAILTGRGGPVLLRSPVRTRPTANRCDPHRPWRAGAASVTCRNSARFTSLRSSPAVEGRCCCVAGDSNPDLPLSCDPHRPWRAGAAFRVDPHRGAVRLVAILTGRGGPVLHRLVEQVGHGVDVAILTGRGGPVLLGGVGRATRHPPALRSSPAVEGRCCLAKWLLMGEGVLQVAILTGRGGPVLPSPQELTMSDDPVAILTGRGGPVLPCGWTTSTWSVVSCDPHRPWRAGAAHTASTR